ncbi:hypothetical protein HD842_002408 [Massilia aurea]|jgi:hypothetical protein|uniref:Ice-binding protein C-terminal domain-containing protein n=1 Tax=Massilia aurea TaxID=373040 RepID=A0A7W9X0K6_9BURK|nr:flocculation-associated PEP-CTERM protein PepA [Massilia aurea]MBB6134266.1 hypothetical protein [Massilia aurea]
MNAFKKTIVAASIAAASLFSATASAGVFEVNPTGSYANFTADRIGGTYTEIATFNQAAGTFNVSLYWDATSFVSNGVSVKAGTTGLGVGYSMYALYKAAGTFVTTGAETVFTFLPGTGGLSLFLDAGNNTVKTANATTGSGNFTFANTADDVELATGIALAGEGNLDPTLSTCGTGSGVGINCGSFGSDTTFNLTGPGANFFVSPNPFYNLSFQSGQLTRFSPTATQTITGSLDVVFEGQPSEVPEPASVGLLGLGMLGLYAARRRNKKAA